MYRIVYKSKIHRATVTECNLNYSGSITIDKALLDAADILPNERVQVLNINNGARFETYVMEGRPNSGVICMNGPAARWAQPGDKILIVSYALLDEKELSNFRPRLVYVDEKNRLTKQAKKDD